MNKLLEKVYYSSPVFAQNMLTSFYGLKLRKERYGGQFTKYLNELQVTQWYSRDKLYELQINKLKNLLLHCQSTVPYYTKMFNEIGFDPTKLQSLDDLKKIPILTKDIVRKNSKSLISNSYEVSDTLQINTSGTTGTPLNLTISKDGRVYNYAFFERFKKWAGIDTNDVNATFAGRVLLKSKTDKPPFWRSNLFFKNTQFSSYHLNKNNIPAYIDKLLHIKPVFIDSYPSSIYVVARYLNENGNPGIFPKAIITSSETLFDYQRQCIEDVFRCHVYDQYGSAEQVAFISQCEKGRYHINPEYGVVEVLDSSGNDVCETAGNLVCTGFTNYAMPLIRYDIGDSVILSKGECDCGRFFPIVEKILGRTDDLLRKADGTPIGRLDPIFKGITADSIVETQIVQDEAGIHIKLVRGSMFKEHDIAVIMRELQKRIGESSKIDVEYVDSISKSPNGKFKAVICNLHQ